MLPDQLCQLLTAYVDGELSTRRRKAVLRLLQHSAEARALLRQLQDDAAQLRQLPRLHLDPDFPAHVVSGIHQHQQAQRERQSAGRAMTIPLWGGFAAAAGVLLAVSLGSFLYFSGAKPPHSSTDLLIGQHDPFKTRDTGKQPRQDIPEPLPHPSELFPEEIAVLPRVVEDPLSPTKPKNPDGSDPPVFTEPVEDMLKPRIVKVDIAPIHDVHKLDVAKLTLALAKHTAAHVELPCRKTVEAFKALELALHKKGIKFVRDPEVQNRIDKSRLPAHFAIFLEDITPRELADALVQVGKEDAKARRTKNGDQFSQMIVQPLDAEDRNDLRRLFHFDTEPLTQPKPAGKPTVSAASDRLGLVVVFNPVRPQRSSPALRLYTENRTSMRPGTIQALLVLREPPPR